MRVSGKVSVVWIEWRKSVLTTGITRLSIRRRSFRLVSTSMTKRSPPSVLAEAGFSSAWAASGFCSSGFMIAGVVYDVFTALKIRTLASVNTRILSVIVGIETHRELYGLITLMHSE